MKTEDTETTTKEGVAGCLLVILLLPLLFLDAWILMTAWNLGMPLAFPKLPRATYVQAIAIDTFLTVLWMQFSLYNWSKDLNPTKCQDALTKLLNRKFAALLTLGCCWLMLWIVVGK